MHKNNVFLSFASSKRPSNSQKSTQLPSNSFEESKRFLFEYLVKGKNQTSPLNVGTKANESSNKAYLLSGLKAENSKDNIKNETSLSEKPPSGNNCVIQINIRKERIRFNVDCSGKTSTMLVELMLKKIKEFEETSMLQRKENSHRPIIGFSSTTGLILIDYILALKNVKLDFLQNIILIFTPIYADLHFLHLKTQKVSLKHFEFLKLIGSGGFSKVFLGK